MITTLIVNRFGGYNKLRYRYLNLRSGILKTIISLLNRGYEIENGCYLPFNNSVDGPINFPHGTSGIFISGGAKIGMNCTIYQQVTIGSNMLIDSTGFGHPTIGNNCLIGAGAKIIGNVLVGHNCRIGANAVVTKDVPNNCLVVSVNQHIITKENLNNHVYQIGDNNEWGYITNGKFVLETDELILKQICLKLKERKTFL